MSVTRAWVRLQSKRNRRLRRRPCRVAAETRKVTAAAAAEPAGGPGRDVKPVSVLNLAIIFFSNMYSPYKEPILRRVYQRGDYKEVINQKLLQLETLPAAADPALSDFT